MNGFHSQPYLDEALTTSNASSLGEARQTFERAGRRRPYTTSPGLRPPLTGSSSSNFGPLPRRAASRPEPGASERGLYSASEISFPAERDRTLDVVGRDVQLQSLVPATASQTAPSQKQQQQQQDEAMDRIYDLLMKEEVGFIGGVDRMLLLHEQARARKTKQLHSEFETEIFDRVQEQVSTAVNHRSAREIERRGRKLMQRFIDTSNSKYPHGICRDIIIPSEYDPMEAHTLSRIAYDPCTRRDPCKLELRQHMPGPGDHRIKPEYSGLRLSGLRLSGLRRSQDQARVVLRVKVMSTQG